MQPIGATLFSSKTDKVLTPGTHGSTFGANLVASAGALCVMKRLDDKLLYGVKRKGEYFKKELLKFAKVKSVSGLGLMLGVEIEGDIKDALKRAMDKGLLLLTAKDKLRLLPPLNISYKLINRGLNILKEVLS